MKHFSNFLIFFSTFIGCFLTIYVSNQGFPSVFASSFIALLGAYFAMLIQNKTNIADSVFCGSFAGMISMNLLSGGQYSFFLMSLLLSILVGIIYTLIKLLSSKYPKKLFNGFGGKLGTTAFISVFLFSFIFGEIAFFSFTETKNISLTIIGVAILGAFFTNFLGEILVSKIKNNENNLRIIAPAILGFLGFFIFNIELSQVFYAGTFAGMTSSLILSRKQVILSGLFTGVFFILGISLFNGFGGKLGTTAFLAVIFTYTLSKIKINWRARI